MKPASRTLLLALLLCADSLPRVAAAGEGDAPGGPSFRIHALYEIGHARNAALLETHMKQLRGARVGVLSLSWCGPGSAEERAAPLVLDAAARDGLRATFHIEAYPARSAASVARDIERIVKTFGPHPAFFRLAGGAGAGKPLLHVRDARSTPAAEWAPVLAPGGPGSVRGTVYDAVVIAHGEVDDGARAEAFVLAAGFDGFSAPLRSMRGGDAVGPRPLERAARRGREHGKLFMPAVSPGVGPPERAPEGESRPGLQRAARYDEAFEEALVLFPDAILIDSFNGWLEGTQVDPAAPGKTPLGVHEDYLRKTREWIGLVEEGFVMSVTGPVGAATLGKALVHEHIVCDFRGARVEGRTPSDPERVAALMLPRVKEVAERGWKSFFDCTPAFIGRDPRILRRLSAETGVRFVTNTGWYGAAGDKFLPASAFDESADQLAARWAAEWHEGIEGTGIRPGFIKVGVDAGPLSAIDRKIVVAAARAHLLTGLTIACHTGEGTAALETLDAVEGEGVRADALIVVHADGIPASVPA
ncbi:MAG TPA: hypothetical protein VMT52_14190, partial [Planctomycetota bacterium]|nr:hypothetical protein [Planctomycetota bacterium]